MRLGAIHHDQGHHGGPGTDPRDFAMAAAVGKADSWGRATVGTGLDMDLLVVDTGSGRMTGIDWDTGSGTAVRDMVLLVAGNQGMWMDIRSLAWVFGYPKSTFPLAVLMGRSGMMVVRHIPVWFRILALHCNQELSRIPMY